MSASDAALLQEAILIRAGWINTLLISGVLLAITVSLIRYNGGMDFELLKIKLPVKTFPYACVAYTIGHIYCAFLFVKICDESRPLPLAWRALNLKGPLIFAGMLPREQISTIPLPFDKSFPIDNVAFEDPTLWLFYGFCIAIFYGFNSSCSVAGYSERRTLVMAWGLVIVNWIIGSIRAPNPG